MAKRKNFNKKQILEGCIQADWYCELTGLPLVLPVALLLFERLTSCAGPNPGANRSHGYYDFRQTRWNAPLNSLTMPVADHKHPDSKGGETSMENLQMLANLVNETKSNDKCTIVPPQDHDLRGALEEQAAEGDALLYWPPSPKFWDDPTRVDEVHAYEGPDKNRQRENDRIKKKKNPRSRNWDGMLGIFLRLYHPTLPEVLADWDPRSDGPRNDRSLLKEWYMLICTYASDHPKFAERYAHLEESGGLWPKPHP